MPNRLRKKLSAWPALVMATAAIAIGGCSTDSNNTSSQATQTTQATQNQAALCKAWGQTMAAFGSYSSIDLANGGADSVRAYVDRLQSSLQTLAGAADAQLAPKVDAFKSAVSDLQSAITSTGSPTDRRTQIRAAAEKVSSSWKALADAARPGCPSSSPSNGQ